MTTGVLPARAASVTSSPWASTPRTDPSSANHGLKVRSQTTSNDDWSSPHTCTRWAGLVMDLPVANTVPAMSSISSIVRWSISGAISRSGLPNSHLSPNTSRAASLALASTMSSPSQASMIAGAVS